MAQETKTAAVGQRPYEMVWANRTNDDHAPLVDFENLSGWHVAIKDAEATFQRTREEQIWGKYVGKLAYRGAGNQPEVRVLPPAPIPIKVPFDAVTLWCYGNNWGWAPDPKTPQVRLTALFADASGKEFAVYLFNVNWTEWYLLHKRLTPEQIERVKHGASFVGLLIAGGNNQEDRTLYFDNLAVFTEQFPPLTFKPRPERGVAMFPGQSVGANTGPGKLPFPTRPETILPDNLTSDFKVTTRARENEFELVYEGKDGRLLYRLKPQTGTWSDVTAEGELRPHDSAAPEGKADFKIHPCLDGGVYLATAKGPVLPERVEHLGTQQKGDTIESRWRLTGFGYDRRGDFCLSAVEQVPRH